MSKSTSKHKFDDITVGVATTPTTLDLFIFEFETRLQERNSYEGATQLLNALSRYELSRILIEAKGAQVRHLLKACLRKQLPVVLAHPKQVIEYVKQVEPITQAEQLDARLIAYFGAKTKPEPHPSFSQKVNHIEQLLEQKQQLNKMHMEELSHRSSMPPAIASLHDVFVQQLGTGIARIDLALAEEVADNLEGSTSTKY